MSAVAILAAARNNAEMTDHNHHNHNHEGHDHPSHQHEWTESPEVDSDETKKIRLRILNAYGDKEFSMDLMRQLFRLLDDDGSGELSAIEIQRGMTLMKFDDAEDPVALSRLLVDIDDDKVSGTIYLFFSSLQNTENSGVCKHFIIVFKLPYPPPPFPPLFFPDWDNRKYIRGCILGHPTLFSLYKFSRL